MYINIPLQLEKIYIGQTNQGLKKRYYNGQGYKHCSYFYNAICKYGIDNFHKEILKENLSLDEANYWEVYYINFLILLIKKKDIILALVETIA